MNKNLYLLGILFLAISLVAGIFHSILLINQGFSLVFLQPYAYWYLAFNIASLISNVFLLRYFQINEWKFVFIGGVVALLIFSVQVIMQYYMLVNAIRQPSLTFTLVIVASIISGIVVGSGFIFSSAGKVRLLKILGVMMIISGILLLIALFATNLGLSPIVTQWIILWVSAASSIFPIFYILVFLRELKTSPIETTSSARADGFYTMLGALGMISLVALLAIGGQLGRESYWWMQWQKNGPAESRKLSERFESRIYVNDQHDTLQYLLLKPIDYDSTKKYPIVTCLHGGPTRIAGSVEVTQPAPMLSEPANRKKYPAFIFVPQAGPGVLWGGIPGIPSAEAIVSEAMTALEAEFSIDENRRYLTGTSGGGYGTWHFMCKYPDRFAAAMPICGAGDPTLAKTIAHVPIWAFHGDVDRNVPVTGSRDMIEAIRSAGGNPKYSEFQNVGHNVWPEVIKTDGVLDWMFSQRKSIVISH